MTKKEAGIFTRRIVGLIIGLVAVFLLVFVAFQVVSRFFRPQDIASMLPKDGVISMVQINTNSHHEQVQRFYEALNKYEKYNVDSIKLLLGEVFQADFDKQINPWIGRQAGFAFVENSDLKGQADLLLFFEVTEKEKALDFLKSRGLQSQEDYLLTNNYNGAEIYRYALSQTYNFVFIKKYLVVANNESILQTVIDASKNRKNQLVSNEAYGKVNQNLPINNLGFGYVDMQKLIEFLKNNEGFMSEKGRELLAFEPFLKLYRSVGFTTVMEGGNLAVQTFTFLNEDYIAGREFIKFDNKFRANLLEYATEDIVFYAGGLDLRKQIERYSDLMSAGGEVSYLIFEGMLNAQKNEYLGQEIDLNSDIYPLLQGEYALVVNKNDNHESVSVFLELADPVRDRDKIESIFDSFVRKSSILAPRVVSVELEDGTTMEEIQTFPEEISRSTENYKGYEINVLTIGTKTWGIYYLILDDILMISTQKDQIHSSIDLFAGSEKSAKNGAIFRESISTVLRTTDEVLYFDMPYLLGKMEIPAETFAGYLEPFKSASFGTNYFKDGISSINYIKID